MKLYKNMESIVGIEIEILYYHMKMDLLVLFVDIMSINESMNSQKYKEKKLIL